jgi:hypothetical protein
MRDNPYDKACEHSTARIPTSPCPSTATGPSGYFGSGEYTTKLHSCSATSFQKQDDVGDNKWTPVDEKLHDRMFEFLQRSFQKEEDEKIERVEEWIKQLPDVKKAQSTLQKFYPRIDDEIRKNQILNLPTWRNGPAGEEMINKMPVTRPDRFKDDKKSGFGNSKVKRDLTKNWRWDEDYGR